MIWLIVSSEKRITMEKATRGDGFFRFSVTMYVLIQTDYLAGGCS